MTQTDNKWTAEKIYNEILEPSFPKKLDNDDVFLPLSEVEKNWVRKEDMLKFIDRHNKCTVYHKFGFLKMTCLDVLKGDILGVNLESKQEENK